MKEHFSPDQGLHCSILQWACAGSAHRYPIPDTLTVLFYIIYPSMTHLEIQKKWSSIGGYGSFRSLMCQCKDPPSDAKMKEYETMMDDMKLHWVKHGKITDETFSTRFNIHGPSVDDKSMKSQRVVHLTHPDVVADTLASMQRKIDLKQ